MSYKMGEHNKVSVAGANLKYFKYRIYFWDNIWSVKKNMNDKLIIMHGRETQCGQTLAISA